MASQGTHMNGTNGTQTSEMREPDAAGKAAEGPTPSEKWREVTKDVILARKVSDSFMTLRDQLESGSFVHWRELQVQRSLGEGGFARVMLASFNPPNGVARQVAVKEIKTELLNDPVEVRQFVEEVKLLRKLKHKYIVGFYGCGWSRATEDVAIVAAAGGQQAPLKEHEMFYLQELVEGGTLQEQVLKVMTCQAGKNAYSDQDALRWALQLAEALEYLHSRSPKVMHRDLKLENVLLTSAKPSAAEVRLADFGLARRLDMTRQSSKSRAEHLSRLTSTASEELDPGIASRKERLDQELGAWLAAPVCCKAEQAHQALDLTAHTGSLGYMAPEVLQGKPYCEKADVFSFGIILYNLVHRNIPSVHVMLNGTYEDLEVYAHNVAHGYRPPISPQVAPWVAALIERCWKGMPELRPSMADVVEQLERLVQAPPQSSTGKGGSGDVPGRAEASSKGCSCCIM